jgi:alpha-tubulin suppressor-like RCC1 family protein
LTTGDVKCWGSGSSGQLGYNNASSFGTVPATVPANLPVVNVVSPSDYASGVRVQQLALGSSHSCALLTNNAVKCWGAALQSGYGISTTIGATSTRIEAVGYVSILSAYEKSIGVTIERLDSGANHVCASLSNSEFKCWGTNTNGVLGYPFTMNSPGSSNNTLVSDLGYVNYHQPNNNTLDCTCACVSPTTTKQFYDANSFIVGIDGVFCESAPSPGVLYCPSETFSEPRCICESSVLFTPSPTQQPTLQPTPPLFEA